jgi:hypothetical protein
MTLGEAGAVAALRGRHAQPRLSSLRYQPPDLAFALAASQSALEDIDTHPWPLQLF